MISQALRAFAAKIVTKNAIDAEDLRFLREAILPFGVTTREDADTLIALERALGPSSPPAFADYLLAEIVDFSVWGSRPTGYIDADTARWLVESLSCGTGPSALAVRIAFEVVREAQSSDEKLVAFVLKAASSAGVAQPEVLHRALAA